MIRFLFFVLKTLFKLLFFSFLVVAGYFLVTGEDWRQAGQLIRQHSPAMKRLVIEKSPESIRSVLPFNPCRQTIYYSLGQIDVGHKITAQEARQVLKKAEEVWEKPTGFNLFEYREGAAFKINFIFDERQQRINEMLKIDEKLEEMAAQQEQITVKYQQLLNERQRKLDKYNRLLKKLNKKIEDYNEKVEKLNEEGDWTKSELKKLERREEEIKEEQQRLEKYRQEVNRLAEKINKLVQQEKEIVQNYNRQVLTYRQKHGGEKKFTQGEYAGDHIDIYEFRDKQDLALILAHEFGHALGLDHVSNSRSIMYYLMSDQDLRNLQLTNEDLEALSKVCGEKLKQ